MEVESSVEMIVFSNSLLVYMMTSISIIYLWVVICKKKTCPLLPALNGITFSFYCNVIFYLGAIGVFQ